MKKTTEIIDFKELESAVPGEGLQGMVRRLARKLGLQPIWSGRGPDGARDLLLTENLKGPLTGEIIKWVVSCKDFSESGKSVQESDLPQPGILDKLKQHGANGFLLVTTTVPSSAAKNLLDKLDKKLVWCP